MSEYMEDTICKSTNLYTANIIKKNQTHPCYSKDASLEYARIHLPVAPKCNIKCNYCNRRYNCVNESRPGVTNQLLSPKEAFELVNVTLKKIPQLTVVGIAGPGDPLANSQQIFETFKRVNQTFPNLHLCLATNGLMLPENINNIVSHNIKYVSVTVNAIEPSISEKIYSWINFNDTIYRGKEGGSILWQQQRAGIKYLVEQGVLVKVNSVLLPGINHDHLVDIAAEVSALGVHTMNIIPFIPVSSTAFTKLRPPTNKEIESAVTKCGDHIHIMQHCKRCRADAIGFLNENTP